MPQPKQQQADKQQEEAAKEAESVREQSAENAEAEAATAADAKIEEAPGGFRVAPTADPKIEEGGSVADVLGKLSTAELRRLANFVSQSLEGQGEDSPLADRELSEKDQLRDKVAGLGKDEDATKKLSAKDAAGKVDVDQKDVLNYAVVGSGQQYLVVVKNDGTKEYAEL